MATKRSSPKKRATAKRTTPKRTVAKKRPAKKASSARRHEPTRGLYGHITHTELASDDPDATKAWCDAALGWAFRPSFPTPDGDYHLFAYGKEGGGGIRGVARGEKPGVVPYVHVADAQASYDKALKAGAEPVQPPIRVMEGVTTALVRAPGGVVIGFSGP